MSLKLIFTQKLDGSFINHDNIEIPKKNFFVKHSISTSRQSFKDFIRLDKECSDRVTKFKREQEEFEKRRSINLQLNQVSVAKELTDLATKSILKLQSI